MLSSVPSSRALPRPLPLDFCPHLCIQTALVKIVSDLHIANPKGLTSRSIGPLSAFDSPSFSAVSETFFACVSEASQFPSDLSSCSFSVPFLHSFLLLSQTSEH